MNDQQNSTPDGSWTSDTTPRPAPDHSWLAEPEPAPKPKRRWLLPVVTAVAGLVVGGAAGSSGGTQEATSPATARPAVTVTQEVPIPAQTVKDETAIRAAREALDKSERVAQLGAKALGLAGDGFTAIAAGDIATLTERSQQMREMTPEIQSAVSEYRAARAQFETLAR